MTYYSPEFIIENCVNKFRIQYTREISLLFPEFEKINEKEFYLRTDENAPEIVRVFFCENDNEIIAVVFCFYDDGVYTFPIYEDTNEYPINYFEYDGGVDAFIDDLTKMIACAFGMIKISKGF